jgi:hypothetical protein
MAKRVKFGRRTGSRKKADTSFNFGANVMTSTQKRTYRRRVRGGGS